MSTSDDPPVVPAWRRRTEDHRFITGTATYVGDLAAQGKAAGALTAAFVRSPEAHAEIRSIDTSRAARMPDVVAVFTGEDLPIGHIPGTSMAVDTVGMDRPVLATEVVRFAGEALAVVIAESAAVAVDATEAVEVDLDSLPVVASADAALNDDVVLHAAAGTNIVERWSLEPAQPPAPAAIEVSLEVDNGRVVPSSIEPLAILATPDGDRLTVHVGHQAPHRLQRQLAPLLDMPQADLRVVVPDVGGAFGMKGMQYPEYAVIAASARALGRPVQWQQGRREHFTNGTHGRALRHHLTLRGDADGRFTSIELRILSEVGAYPHNGSQIPTFSRYVATGLYDIASVGIETATVVTNRAPTGPYRGAGRPEAAFALERAVDAFARAAGLDPADVRRKNLVATLPFVTATGALYDSGDYRAALDVALELVDVGEIRKEQTARRRDGRDPIGLGIGAFIERAGGPVDTGEYAEITCHPSGRLELRTGSTSTGQGHETVWPQVVAAGFGLDATFVDVVAGDTDLVARGTGSSASRSTMIGASAALRVSRRLAIRVRSIAAELLEADVADIEMTPAGPGVVGTPGAVADWPSVVAAAESTGEPLTEAEWYVPGAQTFPYGVHVAVVEVELAAGEVKIRLMATADDVGNVVNPVIVEGQSVGSLMQGIGQARYEEVVYDEYGQLLTGSFMAYSLPTASDMPPVTSRRLVNPAPSNALGAKGAGESGCIGAPPAIVNAALDALAPYGVSHLEMPLTPHRVWTAIQDGSARGSR